MNKSDVDGFYVEMQPLHSADIRTKLSGTGIWIFKWEPTAVDVAVAEYSSASTLQIYQVSTTNSLEVSCLGLSRRVIL